MTKFTVFEVEDCRGALVPDYSIMGPDGVALDILHADRGQVEMITELLNKAYEMGRQAGLKYF